MSNSNNIKKLYQIQLQKVLNRIPINEIKIFLKQYSKYKIGKTKLEKNETLPFYYNFTENIYKDLLKICKKNNIYLRVSFSPYSDRIYFLNNIPIIIIVNNHFTLNNKFMNLMDIYLRYSLPIYYNSSLFATDLENYINIDNETKLTKLSKDKLNIINDNRNSKKISSEYLSILNSDNYIISGIGAYNYMLDDTINEEYNVLLMFNTDIEFMKILQKDYYIDKIYNKFYFFKQYYNIYDKDKLIMRIFDMKKTPISIYKNTNYTNPHGTIMFLLLNYLIDGNILYSHLAYNLIYELKKNTNNILDNCFNNNFMKNNIEYIINSKLN